MFFAQLTNPSAAAPAEHVVLFNLTTYEIAYLLIMVVYVIVVVIQTFLLKWYADETKKMREHAGEQSGTIAKQYAALAEQNSILSETLKLNTSAFQFQQSEAEKQKKELEEAQKQSEADAEREAEPAFRENVQSNTGGKLLLMLKNIKENVWLEEVRANFDILRIFSTPRNANDDNRVLFEVANRGHDIMVGIRYKRRADSMEKHQVFTVNTGTGKTERLRFHDFFMLPVDKVKTRT